MDNQINNESNNLNNTQINNQINQENNAQIDIQNNNVEINTNEVIKNQNTSKKIKNTISTVLWVLIIIWMCTCLYDFFNVKSERDPKFCINKGTNTYEDGNVNWCLGVGYKVYQYNRKSINAIEFGPFWSKERNKVN